MARSQSSSCPLQLKSIASIGMDGIAENTTKEAKRVSSKTKKKASHPIAPEDDGSLDWYMHYVEGPKNSEEMRRRRERELKSKEANKRDKAQEEVENAKILQLPLWSEDARGVPNSVLRGSLFAAIQERYAKYVKRMVLHDTVSLKIIYTGMRLTQSDLDVWEYALHLARNQQLGNKIFFTGSSFLRGIDRNTGKKEHNWLNSVLSRISATTIEITHNNKTYGGSLIDEFYRDEETGRYCVVINPKISRLYDAGHTYINWQERKMLGKKKPLAQWLHGYISSHTNWVPHRVSTIRDYSGSVNKELRSFKSKLKDALEYLIEKKVICSYQIDNNDLLHIEMKKNA